MEFPAAAFYLFLSFQFFLDLKENFLKYHYALLSNPKKEISCPFKCYYFYLVAIIYNEATALQAKVTRSATEAQKIETRKFFIKTQKMIFYTQIELSTCLLILSLI